MYYIRGMCLFLPAVLFLLSASGCGTMSNGRCWGDDAYRHVNMGKIKKAAHNAFFDLQTLVPAAGALIFAIDDYDEEVSDWASNHSRLFDSIEDAKDASDVLRGILLAETVVTVMILPSGDDKKHWSVSKLKGLSVELAALGATSSITARLKDLTDRTRPDNTTDNSLPSAHASGAFSAATLSNRNLDNIDMPKKLRRTLQTGNICLAAGVAWARVEGKRHYPSDVLAGAALGHFLSAFIHDAFMNAPEEDRFDFIIYPYEDGVGVEVGFRF